jgi:tetratricopeptide (TPR) repeat protein
MKSVPAQRPLLLLAALALALFAAPAIAQTDFDASLQDLREHWAVANHEKRGLPRIAALDTLAQSAVRLTALHPDRVEVWIWSGMIQATLASAGTGINSLNAATAARIDLERALALDPEAMEGAAYTTLGALYYKMPGWPVGFGDREKAEKLLRLALKISPDGMDSNYFYGDFLLEQGHRRKAREHLLRAQRAQQAPPHPGDALAHAGRQRDIAKLLARIDAQ